MATVSSTPDRRAADTARRRELAAFLRSRRDRLAPEAVGLPAIGRRRAPGLRREEVAQLAGVGGTWYTWLEQGRSINVSRQVVTAIARALRLDADESAHLFTLTGLSDPGVTSEDDLISGSLSAILDGLDPLPAHVVTPRYDLLAWNRASAGLMGDFSTLPPHRRNILWLMFTEPDWARMFGGYETETGLNCVGRFRRNFAAHVGDPGWRRFLNELLEQSPQFRTLWERHEVSSFVNRIKVFDHPVLGTLRFGASTLWLADQPGDRLVVYTPLDEECRELVDRLPDLPSWAPWGQVAG